MGITKPRQAIGARQARIIISKLVRYHELTAQYVEEGMSKDAASRKAFEQVQKETAPC